ncbi:MAG TPA: hypothetical protein VIQ80_01635 [Candidatus Saccharimonadales bacterium]
MAFVRITCTGTSFAPVVALRAGSTATVSWTVEGGATTTGLSPTITLPGGTSYVDFNVSTSGVDTFGDVTVFNLGYSDADDVGTYMIGPSYNLAAQPVTGLQSVNLMTNLQIFCAAHTNLTGAVDFSGMSALQHIECYLAKISSINLTGCTSMVRLCLEQNSLSSIDLNPIAAHVYDIRLATQTTGTLTFTPLTAPLANAYHFCVRDQVIINHPTVAQLPAIQQQWTWNTNQTGAFAPASTALSSVMAYGNWYTSVNVANLMTTGYSTLDVHNNNLTSVNLTGCTGLWNINLSNNNLSTAQVDTILTTVNSWGTNWGVGFGILNLGGNRPPSAAGEAAKTALQGRNWTVTTETLTSASRVAGVIGDEFHRPNATGIANVGNGWFSSDGATANISGNTLVRTDSGGFRRFLNSGGGLLPPDYTVTARIPGATLGSYFGLIGRWGNNGDGVQAFFAGAANIGNFSLCSASGFLVRTVSFTTLATFPASWSNTSIDHTFALQMVGTTVTVILDGVAVVQATMPNNATAYGTGYGICGEGQNRAWYSITTTASERSTASAAIL